MNYRVLHPSPSSEKRFIKDLSDYPEFDQEAIIVAVENLGQDPRPHGYTKLTPPSKVCQALAYYRIRVGRYRIFYDIVDSEKKVFILAVKRRNEQTY